jgi:hypothetical protein
MQFGWDLFLFRSAHTKEEPAGMPPPQLMQVLANFATWVRGLFDAAGARVGAGDAVAREAVFAGAGRVRAPNVLSSFG